MFVCVNFTTSHPQQSPVDSTRAGTDYVNQLNTEMNGNFILLHLVSLGNSFAICLRNLYKRIKWDPKPLSQEVLLRYNQLLTSESTVKISCLLTAMSVDWVLKHR